MNRTKIELTIFTDNLTEESKSNLEYIKQKCNHATIEETITFILETGLKWTIDKNAKITATILREQEKRNEILSN